MNSTKKEIGCGPDSSGVVGLVGLSGVLWTRDKKKAVVYLTSTCFVHLFSYWAAALSVPLTGLRVRYNPDAIFSYGELSYFLGV